MRGLTMALLSIGETGWFSGGGRARIVSTTKKSPAKTTVTTV